MTAHPRAAGDRPRATMFTGAAAPHMVMPDNLIIERSPGKAQCCWRSPTATPSGESVCREHVVGFEAAIRTVL